MTSFAIVRKAPFGFLRDRRITAVGISIAH